MPPSSNIGERQAQSSVKPKQRTEHTYKAIVARRINARFVRHACYRRRPYGLPAAVTVPLHAVLEQPDLFMLQVVYATISFLRP